MATQFKFQTIKQHTGFIDNLRSVTVGVISSRVHDLAAESADLCTRCVSNGSTVYLSYTLVCTPLQRDSIFCADYTARHETIWRGVKHCSLIFWSISDLQPILNVLCNNWYQNWSAGFGLRFLILCYFARLHMIKENAYDESLAARFKLTCPFIMTATAVHITKW